MKYDFNKLLNKFRYNPNSVKKNYDGRTDIYLAKVSYRYAYLKRVIALLLILVTVAFVLSENITYEKIYYLTKDVKLANDYVNSVHDTITYNVGNSQSFALYRGGLAVASRERLSIFSAGGRELFSSNHSYANPALDTSDKFVLLYDVGGKQFSLYNSFSKSREEFLDYSIYGADIARNGNFAIITKSDKYDSVVRVYLQGGTYYDYNFSDGRVCSVSLSENGSLMAVALVFSDGDEIRSEIRLYKTGKTDYDKTDVRFSGVPYEVKILTNGNVAAVGANGVNVFGSSLNFLGDYSSDEKIYLYSFGEDSIALSHSTANGSKTKLVLINKRGGVEREKELSESVINIAVYGDVLFVQKLNSFDRINLSLNITESAEFSSVDAKLIALDKNTIVVCNNSYAKFINFGR